MFTRDMTLSEVIRISPRAISALESMEIDYSCQGQRALADAAHAAGYRVEDVIARLDTEGSGGDREIDWFAQPLPSLIDYLTDDHRRTVGDHLPQLRGHIDALPESSERQRIHVLFRYLADALTSHVFNEERELFPFINHLHSANNQLIGAPKMRISQRVLHELVEHEGFLDRLRTLNELADRLPSNDSVRAFRRDLRTFSEQVRRHMHLENNVLYPRAIEIENGLRRTAAAV